MTSDTIGGRGADLDQLSCVSLVDAMARLHGHRAHLLPLVSPEPTRALFGSDEARRIEAEDDRAAAQIRHEDLGSP